MSVLLAERSVVVTMAGLILLTTLVSVGISTAFVRPAYSPSASTHSLSGYPSSPTTTGGTRRHLLVNGPRTSASDLPGVDVETGFVLFDPLGLARDEEALYRRRCVEIKHGRVAMVAVLGLLVPDLVSTFPGTLSFSPNLQFSDVPTGLQAITALPVLGWIQIIGFVGVLELAALRQDPAKQPGDVGGAGWLRYPEPQRSNKLLIELKNGRLAMIAVTWMLVSEALTGQSAADQVLSGAAWGS